jgi:two-component system nitrate/nitrite sensor histidine kinase NarX
VELARQAQGGDLSVRASHVGGDELGTLGHAFNLMATDLSAMYADLEARVEQQTQALQIKNRSLELLYHTARQLAEPVPEVSSYSMLLAEIEKLTGPGSIRLCLIDPVNHQATEVFSAPSGLHPSAVSLFCTRPHCEVCLGDGNTHPLATDREVFSIPIRDQERQFGVLIVRNPDLEAETTWQLPLLETVARQIAAALRASEQIEHRHRLALLEERNAIARELHDSLAQSLSYLKIQVSRLQTLADGTDFAPESRAIIAELREVLNSAYRQLRELIATFRLQMEHLRLEDNLREAIREFGRRGNLTIQLDLAGWHSALDAHEQLQVMHIVREALNNAVKHARASQIVVRLREMPHGEVMIEVADNGIGLPEPFERDNHFGLHIMRERADHLGGMLSLHSRPGDGLQVRLRFIPTTRRRFLNVSNEVQCA